MSRESGKPPQEYSVLVFFVNGRKIVEANADPEVTLLQYLREKLCLRGTKLVCGEGGCGACTVMVSRLNRETNNIRHFTVNACIAPLCSMHGLSVTTVEGIGSISKGLHPVQERLAKSHGSQCGFCTPGMVMTMYTLLRNNPLPSAMQLEQAFDGNLCRCTGYRPILEGYKTFTKESCAMGDKCCRNNAITSGDVQNNKVSPELFDDSEFTPFDQSQETIFPPELQMTSSYDKESLVFVGEKVTWIRPVTLEHLLKLKTQYPQARLMDIGMDKMLYTTNNPIMIARSHVPELSLIEQGETGVSFGASVTISRVQETLKELTDAMPEHETRTLRAIHDMLDLFAGPQIRNVATIGGSLITVSPVSDLNTLFMATRTSAVVQSKDGDRRAVKIDADFFTGFRKTVLKPEDVVISITIPYSNAHEYVCGYKQSHRRWNDIAIVNAGMSVQFKPDSDVVENIILSFGGMAATTVLVTNTMQYMVGMRWNDGLLDRVSQLLPDDLPLSPEAPGGMAEYRRTLSLSFFFKFYLMVRDKIDSQSETSTKSTYRSAFTIPAAVPSQSCQVFEEVAPGQLSQDPVGRPCKTISIENHATGEAVYVDDMPRIEGKISSHNASLTTLFAGTCAKRKQYEFTIDSDATHVKPFISRYDNNIFDVIHKSKGELHAAVVLSSKAHAKLLNVDPSEALTMPGVVDYVGHNDITGRNICGTVVMDEEMFATDMVYAQGQVIGMIIADSHVHAQKAARVVKVQYEELEHIITNQEAIQKSSYHGTPEILETGDIEAGFAESDHILEGSYSMEGQEHFYFEPQCCIALPKNEDGEMEVFSSTQDPTTAQNWVATALGVPRNRIVARVKRIGGGFGGKCTRSSLVAAITAVAANKLHRPVRLVLDRDVDILFSGARDPVYNTYKVGLTKEGKMKAADINIYINAGWSTDYSPVLLSKLMKHAENCYYFPNFRVTGYASKTNTPSSTAFRGLGTTQAVLLCENMMEDISTTFSLNPLQVREMNLYKDGDITPYRQIMEYCTVRRCWTDCLQQSDFSKRQEDIKRYNRENRWTKRGISVCPTKFGASLDVGFLNQAGALVQVYTDGSVLLTHGGVEMGQGLHTKMIQVASRVLQIPTDKIHISETGTNTVPNTSPTASSVSSDLNGMAVLRACTTIVERLEPYKTASTDGQWGDWVKAAYLDEVSLSATGFYKVPELYFDAEKNLGRKYNYHCHGVACSEVQIDCLTGDSQILRTDIVMDVGTSLNPAIDIGQIEGGFMQGYGMMCLEQQKFTPSGGILSLGARTYTIPSVQNIPREFNVSLLKSNPNPRAVYSSKAVGEPPLSLASTVLFAIKDAIKSARSNAGFEGNFPLLSPATPERIRMACADQFTEKFPAPDPGSYKPWFVTRT